MKLQVFSFETEREVESFRQGVKAALDPSPLWFITTKRVWSRSLPYEVTLVTYTEGGPRHEKPAIVAG